jgi:hypothetical protein
MLGQILGTGYYEFSTTIGISGLAKAEDGRLDLLAVLASKPGTGQFREFITQAKKSFKTIAVWAITNNTLREALIRYGFRRFGLSLEWKSGLEESKLFTP